MDLRSFSGYPTGQMTQLAISIYNHTYNEIEQFFRNDMDTTWFFYFASKFLPSIFCYFIEIILIFGNIFVVFF